MTDVDDFIAHYGKKGMKWGVRNDNDVKAARKQARKEIRADNQIRSQYTRTKADGSTGVKKAKTAAIGLDMVTTLGMYTGSQIARSSGFTKGQSAAIGIVGGPGGAMLAREIKVRNTARRMVG